jgi:hypothetical protein
VTLVGSGDAQLSAVARRGVMQTAMKMMKSAVAN